MGTGSFPEVKSGLGVTLTPHPLLVPWSRKNRAITLLPLGAVRPVQSLSACTRVHSFNLDRQLICNICFWTWTICGICWIIECKLSVKYILLELCDVCPNFYFHIHPVDISLSPFLSGPHIYRSVLCSAEHFPLWVLVPSKLFQYRMAESRVSVLAFYCSPVTSSHLSHISFFFSRSVSSPLSIWTRLSTRLRRVPASSAESVVDSSWNVMAHGGAWEGK